MKQAKRRSPALRWTVWYWGVKCKAFDPNCACCAAHRLYERTGKRPEFLDVTDSMK